MAKLLDRQVFQRDRSQSDVLNASLPFDSRLYRQDITGFDRSCQDAGKTGIISKEDQIAIVEGLQAILSDIEEGKLIIEDAEDIHTFVEQELTARIQDSGNVCILPDQEMIRWHLDMRMYVKEELQTIRSPDIGHDRCTL